MQEAVTFHSSIYQRKRFRVWCASSNKNYTKAYCVAVLGSSVMFLYIILERKKQQKGPY